MENPFRLKRFSDVIIWSLCHDVRGPVASLSGLLNIIDTSSLSKENAKLIELMRQSVAKADDSIKIMVDCHSNSLLLSRVRSDINTINDRKKKCCMKNRIKKIKSLIRKIIGIDEERIADQLRRPSGWLANRVGKQMNESNQAIYDAIFNEMKSNSKNTSLEIGFGNGLFFPRYFEEAKSSKVSGIEMSEKMVELARKRNKKESRAGLLDLRIASSSSIPYPNSSFDTVVCVNVIYFWDYPAEHLKEINRVLKPGGIFYVGMRPEESLKNVPFAKHGFILYSEQEWRDRVQGNNLLHIKTMTFLDSPIEINEDAFPVEGMVMLFQRPN